MKTIKKEVEIEKGKKIKVVIDSGFACRGHVEIAYFDTVTSDLNTLKIAELEDGAIEVAIPDSDEETRIAVFGTLTPLPGKESVRLDAWLYEDNLIAEAIRIEDANFNIQFIVKKVTE